MRKLDTIEVTAPSAWASYLLDGDASGLEDNEQAQCDAWIESLAPHTCCIGCNDADFMWRHDAWQFCPLGADCQLYTFANYGSVRA